ncbi:MAG: ATP-binding protein [Halioglobus sp.]|nr:ATP-binding protein [Halioglobus sp.]
MNYAYKYAVAGALFGCLFLGAAWFLGLYSESLRPTFSNIIQIHVENPVIAIVDTAPLVLGLSFYYLGKAYQSLYVKNSEALDNSARFDALMNSAFDAIIITNFKGMVLDFNSAAETMFGHARQDVIGKQLSGLIIPSRYRGEDGQVLGALPEAGEGRSIGQRVPIEAIHQDGHEFSVEISIEKHSISADGFEKNAFVAFIHDITVRKETAAQIIQASKLATLGEMATSVAHELNQPLSVIRMAAENSRRKMSSGSVSAEYLTDKLQRIEEQTERAASIIDHMRMFGREANEGPALIDPRNVIANVLDLIGEQLRLVGIEVVTECPKDCPSILGHTIQVEQVILNLLTNAKDAMSVREETRKIILRIFYDQENVYITCEDTGGGIAENVLPRVFEPFYTTKEIGKGTGLGLSVSYGIIRDMKGSITAENSNDGARFTIILPVASQEGLLER